MKTSTRKSRHKRLVIGGITLILLATLGIGAITAWGRTSGDIAGTAAVFDKIPVAAENEMHTLSRCAECGIVEAIREIPQAGGEKKVRSISTVKRSGRDESSSKPIMPAARYEMTVRMRNGESRVFVDANPANWRPGERVTVIEGISRSNKSPPPADNRLSKKPLQQAGAPLLQAEN
jgi:hypothetical protein